ncbi:hypothetical protein KUH32_03245 [Thalassococcus sp. CAU 1522]|uniref:Uncharacterized protein n=1 Tax=Thalassococcus arenae TaxID=2851652 RepID=A0ABS6N433_9RHOB|nr:hypothetical protein [Thalassococcus arenae]MBV2358777.1 hypothetical protein [Thalassococcus arenae]
MNRLTFTALGVALLCLLPILAAATLPAARGDAGTPPVTGTGKAQPGHR